MAVSDIVTSGVLPEEVKASMNAWVGCMAGAMDAEDMVALLETTGFVNIVLNPVYFSEELVRDSAKQVGISPTVDLEDLRTRVFSANISAEKPAS